MINLKLSRYAPTVNGMSKPVNKEQVAKVVNGTLSISCKKNQVIDMVMQAISLFKEYESPNYYSFTEAKIKKPQSTHSTSKGRYNQKDARTILISALTRAWALGTEKKATISNKNEYDSPFVMFATDVFNLVGIGNIHKHLESYTSIRKADFVSNELIKDFDLDL